MATNFPTSLDALTNPTSSDNLNTAGVELDVVVSNLNDAVEALEAKVGIDSSAVATSLDYRVDRLYRHAKYRRLVDDFDGTNNFFGSANAGSGAGVNYHTTIVSGRPGVIQLATGTTTSGKAIVGAYVTAGNFPSSQCLGDGSREVECYFRIPTLSDGTDTYFIFLGFGDNAGGGTPADGVYFAYTHGVNSGKFTCVTRSNNVETASDSGVTVTANQWYKGKLVVNAAGTSVDFYLATDVAAYGAAVATNTTNIPTGSARAVGYQYSITKTAGTGSRTLELDLIAVTMELTVER